MRSFLLQRLLFILAFCGCSGCSSCAPDPVPAPTNTDAYWCPSDGVGAKCAAGAGECRSGLCWVWCSDGPFCIARQAHQDGDIADCQICDPTAFSSRL